MKRKQSPISSLVAVLAILFAAPPKAQAHHGCNTPGALWGQNVNLLRLDAQSKVFGTHQALSLVPSISYAPFDFLSVGARLPYSQMTITQNGQQVSGLGDLELNLQGTAFKSSNNKFVMLLGSEFEIPTGDSVAGTSGGHYAITPHATLAFRLAKRWLLASATQYTHGLEGGDSSDHHDDGHDHSHDHHHDDATNSYALSPHSTQELKTSLGASYLGKDGYVTVIGEAIYGVSGPQGLGPVSVILETGINLTKDLVANWRIAMPVAGEIRESWTITSGVIWRWGADADTTFTSTQQTTEEVCDCPSEVPSDAACACPSQASSKESACEGCENPAQKEQAETSSPAPCKKTTEPKTSDAPCEGCDNPNQEKATE